MQWIGLRVYIEVAGGGSNGGWEVKFPINTIFIAESVDRRQEKNAILLNWKFKVPYQKSWERLQV